MSALQYKQDLQLLPFSVTWLPRRGETGPRMRIKSAIASHSRNRLAAEKRTCGRIPLRDCFQVVSPRRRRDQTKAWVPTEGYFTKKAAGMRVIWLSTRFYQCAQLSCAQASPFSRWNKGLRGQTAPPPSIPKNENTKMENRLSRAGSAHFPSGWLTQAKIFFFFTQTNFHTAQCGE